MVEENSLSTGIDKLDEQTIKGIPKGSTIVYLGDPLSMANLFLVRLANTPRNTHYTTITRNEYSIKKEIKQAREVTEDERAEFGNVDVHKHYQSQNNLSSDINKYIDRPGTEENLIIDNFSIVEDRLSHNDYERVVRDTIKATRQRNGLTVLYLLKNNISELTLHERDLLNSADGVFRFTSQYEQGNRKDRLQIYKLRGKRNIPEGVINLKVGKKITVSSSKKI